MILWEDDMLQERRIRFYLIQFSIPIRTGTPLS